MQKRKLAIRKDLSIGKKKDHTNCLLRFLCSQQTSGVTIGLSQGNFAERGSL